MRLKILRLNSLEKFIAKRVLIIFGVLVILNLIFVSQRMYVMLGLIIGSIFGFMRFSSLGATISRLVLHDKSNTVKETFIRYMVNHVAMIVLCAVSIRYSLWMFIGVIAGVLIIPVIIMINGITEGLGVTHNRFE
jgi:hypothetical protein